MTKANRVKKYFRTVVEEYGKVVELENRVWRF